MSKLALIDELTPLFSSPEEAQKTICVHVSNGGSLLELCKMWGIPFGLIMHWIRSNPSLSKSYDQAQEDRQEWYRETILRELRMMASFDARELLNSDGTVKPVNEWSDSLAACIASFEVSEIYQGTGKDKEYIGEAKKVKVWAKDKSLELIGKYLQMFTQRVEIGAAQSLADMVNASIERPVTEAD